VVGDPEWVAIGRLWRVRGTRGELLGELDSSEPGREDRLKDVALEAGGQRRVIGVEQVWRHNGRPVFKFAGIDSISDAEPWQGAEILVPASEIVRPEEGAYSYADLTNCRMETAGSGELVGVVKGVEEYGGPPLLKVEAVDGREILVPFARSICREIDVAAKTIRVALPEGLLDLP
jgi:16S rRNA processing protein RimM